MEKKTHSFRTKFNNFTRSKIGLETKSLLYKQQYYMCFSCRESKNINELEIHHLYPLSLLEKENNFNKVVSIQNLALLCRRCNAKQSNKIDNRLN